MPIQDFAAMKRKFKFFSNTFTFDVECVSEELLMELLDLSCDSLLKEKYTEVDVLEFFEFLPNKKYPLLFDSSLRIVAMFGSIYVCEQFFTSIQINKFFLRTKLTDEHLQSVLRLVNGNGFKPSSLLLFPNSIPSKRWGHGGRP